jgi:hypothetical protein
MGDSSVIRALGASPGGRCRRGSATEDSARPTGRTRAS